MKMQSLLERVEITCATEVFLATALLHRERPERVDFTIREIVDRAAREKLAGRLRQGVNVHASQHCVANRAPNPSRHKMLYATGKHTRRLLLPMDDVHPERTGKIFPDLEEVPEKYLALLEWAKSRYERGRSGKGGGPMNSGLTSPPTAVGAGVPEEPRSHLQALLELRLAGAHLANDEDPDDYIRRLREGWE
jgi:hypothetical protein